MARFASDLLGPLLSTSRVLADDPEADAVQSPARTAKPAAAPAVDEIDVLYRRHHALVFRVALRYGRGNVAWAEDITQEVFLGVFRALEGLTEREEMEGWLYTATTNRCLSKLRRERLLDFPPIRWLLGESRTPVDSERHLQARDALKRAFAVLDLLPPKERVAFSMYYLDGLEQEEIGKILGHSKGQICKLIQRAVKRLRDAGLDVSDV